MLSIFPAASTQDGSELVASRPSRFASAESAHCTY